MTAPRIDFKKPYRMPPVVVQPDPLEVLMAFVDSPLADSLFRTLGRPNAIQVLESPKKDPYTILGEVRGLPPEGTGKEDTLDLYSSIVTGKNRKSNEPSGPPRGYSNKDMISQVHVLAHELGHHFGYEGVPFPMPPGAPDEGLAWQEYNKRFATSPLGVFKQIIRYAPSPKDNYARLNGNSEWFAQSVAHSIDFLRATQGLDFKDPDVRNMVKLWLKDREEATPGMQFVTRMILEKPNSAYANHPLLQHYKDFGLDNPPVYSKPPKRKKAKK